MADEELSVVLNLRISPQDADRLEAFSVSKSHVARVALKLGLAQVEADPMLLVQQPEAKRGPKAKRPRRSDA
ncbi:MAG: hypothetical protein AB7N76_09610 [Planctomycetota bacterium]